MSSMHHWSHLNCSSTFKVYCENLTAINYHFFLTMGNTFKKKL
uniref:Uncharacterized protein n=1 Tax=Anguilla anguilla TaxID=7936 RepID=A0A0E9QMC1_ANGAN